MTTDNIILKPYDINFELTKKEILQIKRKLKTGKVRRTLDINFDWQYRFEKNLWKFRNIKTKKVMLEIYFSKKEKDIYTAEKILAFPGIGKYISTKYTDPNTPIETKIEDLIEDMVRMFQEKFVWYDYDHQKRFKRKMFLVNQEIPIWIIDALKKVTEERTYDIDRWANDIKNNWFSSYHIGLRGTEAKAQFVINKNKAFIKRISVNEKIREDMFSYGDEKRTIKELGLYLLLVQMNSLLRAFIDNYYLKEEIPWYRIKVENLSREMINDMVRESVKAFNFDVVLGEGFDESVLDEHVYNLNYKGYYARQDLLNKGRQMPNNFNLDELYLEKTLDEAVHKYSEYRGLNRPPNTLIIMPRDKERTSFHISSMQKDLLAVVKKHCPKAKQEKRTWETLTME